MVKAILPLEKGAGVGVTPGAGVGVVPALADPVRETSATKNMQANSASRQFLDVVKMILAFIVGCLSLSARESIGLREVLTGVIASPKRGHSRHPQVAPCCLLEQVAFRQRRGVTHVLEHVHPPRSGGLKLPTNCKRRLQTAAP